MQPEPSNPRPWLVVGAIVVALTVDPAAQRQASPSAGNLKTVSHVLNRVTFGPRPGDVERVQAMGVGAFIDEQLHPERIKDEALESRLAGFETLTMSTRELVETYFAPAQQQQRQRQRQNQQQTARQTPSTNPNPQEGMMMTPAPGPSAAGQPSPPTPEQQRAQQLQRAAQQELTESRMLRAALSEKQLQEVLVDFWFNHFNVFMGKGQVREYLMSYERDAIRPHVFGKFRDMLGAVAHSPAMLFYLDNFQSSAPNSGGLPPQAQQRLNDPRLSPQQRQRLADQFAQRMAQAPRQARGLNENYARELMELHTLGVDGGYTQQDVIELARILTGWTIDQPRNGGQFVFRQEMHDTGTKTLLGQTFSNAGEREGERALDLLAIQPATAHHIAFKLAQRFIADQPPASAVDRAANVFMSTKGDLREVVKSIVTSSEIMAPSAYRSKVKTPLEFVVSAVRATGATINAGQPLVAALQVLGMPLYGCQPPTGYSMTADAWVNTGALLNRMNLAVQLLDGGRIQPAGGRGPNGGAPPVRPGQGGVPGTGQQPAPGRGRGRGPQAQPFPRGPIVIDSSSLAADTSSASRDRVVQHLLAGDVSDSTRQTLARAETPHNLIALALGSPEFQRR